MTNNNLSIVLPTKNEDKNLEIILPALKSFSNDIIVVDGHSNDYAKIICDKFNVNFVLDNKLGKGDALRIGAKLAKNQLIIFYDADGSHDISDIKILNEHFVNNINLDLIICSRKQGGSFDLTGNVSFVGFLRSTGCDLLSLMFNKFYGTKFSDVLYGLRAIKKNKFLELDTKENGFGIELEVLIKSVIKNYNIIEIPSRENARIHGKSKLNTFVGLYFIFQLLRFQIYKN
jgi:glycosyltransferase involved in cell wall biosynthesis